MTVSTDSVTIVTRCSCTKRRSPVIRSVLTSMQHDRYATRRLLNAAGTPHGRDALHAYHMQTAPLHQGRVLLVTPLGRAAREPIRGR
jgi:hypothetical protein